MTVGRICFPTARPTGVHFPQYNGWGEKWRLFWQFVNHFVSPLNGAFGLVGFNVVGTRFNRIGCLVPNR